MSTESGAYGLEEAVIFASLFRTGLPGGDRTDIRRFSGVLSGLADWVGVVLLSRRVGGKGSGGGENGTVDGAGESAAGSAFA